MKNTRRAQAAVVHVHKKWEMMSFVSFPLSVQLSTLLTCQPQTKQPCGENRIGKRFRIVMKWNFCEVNERSEGSTDTSRGVHQLRSFNALCEPAGTRSKEKCGKTKNKTFDRLPKHASTNGPTRIKRGWKENERNNFVEVCFQVGGRGCGNFSLLFKNFYYFCCNSIKAGDSMVSDATDCGIWAFSFKPEVIFRQNYF